MDFPLRVLYLSVVRSLTNLQLHQFRFYATAPAHVATPDDEIMVALL